MAFPTQARAVVIGGTRERKQFIRDSVALFRTTCSRTPSACVPHQEVDREVDQ